MITRISKSHRSAAVCLASLSVGAVLLSGCSAIEDAVGGDDTETRSASTGAAGKESGLLADWVPDEATEVNLVQRTTGDERLLTFTYTGALPDTCLMLATPGSPTPEELSVAYASDSRTEDTAVEAWETSPTLDASWWPEGEEDAASALCGRWWVSVDGSTVYAFAPERVSSS